VFEKNIKNKALLVTSRTVHYPIVRPVIEELQKRNWKVTVLHFERLWENVVENILLTTQKRRSLESFYVETPSKPPKKKSLLVYSSISKLISSLMNAVKMERPNIVVVLTDGPLPCKMAVLVARCVNIPSLLLLHVGMIGPKYDCPSFLVDKLAVMGDYARKILIKCGIDKTRLVVTGRPSYDALVRAEEHFEKDNICRKLGLDSTKKIIVYTTENLPLEESKAMVYSICRVVKEFSDSQFIIKVHPSELSLSLYERATRDVGVDALITRDVDIYEVLYVCDIMITGFSATALDAMMLDKPVITVNFTGLEDPLPYAESGATLGVYVERDLVEAIKKGLYDENVKEKLRDAREKFVFEQSYKRDGKATERVVELIEQMVQGADA